MPVKDLDLKHLATETEQYSGADLENLCRVAVMLLIRSNLDADELSMEYFKQALQIVKPSNPQEKIDEFKKLVKENLGEECNFF